MRPIFNLSLAVHPVQIRIRIAHPIPRTASIDHVFVMDAASERIWALFLGAEYSGHASGAEVRPSFAASLSSALQVCVRSMSKDLVLIPSWDMHEMVTQTSCPSAMIVLCS